jgi:hypothetical protein
MMPIDLRSPRAPSPPPEPRELRRRHLWERYGFDCRCARCVEAAGSGADAFLCAVRTGGSWAGAGLRDPSSSSEAAAAEAALASLAADAAAPFLERVRLFWRRRRFLLEAAVLSASAPLCYEALEG